MRLYHAAWFVMVGAPLQAEKPIQLSSGSIVCISAIMEPSTFPMQPTLGAADQSASISSRMAQFYREAGGKDVVEGDPNGTSRFMMEAAASPELCLRPSSIRIHITYQGRPNGHPYQAFYAIEEGARKITGSFGRDLNPTGARYLFDPAGDQIDSDMSEHSFELLRVISDIPMGEWHGTR